MVEYREDGEQNWTLIEQSNIPAFGILCFWDLSSLDDGDYELRLTVNAGGQSYYSEIIPVHKGNCTYVTNITVSPTEFPPYGQQTTTIYYDAEEDGVRALQAASKG